VALGARRLRRRRPRRLITPSLIEEETTVKTPNDLNDPNPARSSDEMQLFVARVQDQGRLQSESEAEVLARATLRHLGQQISSGQAEAIGGALPEELTSEITSGGQGQATGFDKDTFVDQVSAHVHSTDPTEVERQVHVVLATVRSWSPDGQVEGTLAQLPQDLAVLFA
jgi:uncharacterized protein (DUF2267 family)